MITSILDPLFHVTLRGSSTSMIQQTIAFVSLVFPLGNVSLDLRHLPYFDTSFRGNSHTLIRLFLSYRIPINRVLMPHDDRVHVPVVNILTPTVRILSHQTLNGSLFCGWIHASSRFSSGHNCLYGICLVTYSRSTGKLVTVSISYSPLTNL